MAKRSFYTQIGITKKDLNSMASFITFLIIIPIFFINSVGKIITFFLMKYNNNGKQKSKKNSKKF